METPPSKLLRAFGLSGAPQPLPGGAGSCFTVGQVVVKPADDDEQAQWTAEVIETMLARPHLPYRLAKPVAIVDQPGHYVFNGWTASLLIGGYPASQRYEDKLKISRLFHNDLRQVVTDQPEYMNRITNRWIKADKVTWQEAALEDTVGVNNAILKKIKPVLETLLEYREPFSDDLHNQLIHGDLTGNILFEKQADTLPAIIDMTFYWRPAAYAEAIIAADGLAWDHQGRDLIELYGTDETHLQLLVRALYWRCLTLAIDSDEAWLAIHLPKADYEGATNVLTSFLDS